MSDYEPGTLWLVEAGCWANRKVALRLDEGWSHVNGVNVDGDGVVSPVRPLVVLDPDDRKQIERLMRVVRDNAFESGDSYPGMGRFADAMQAALRSQIKPPKPAEPTGLGAVVEDSEGHLWVRTDPDAPAWTRWDASLTRVSYERIDVAKKLSDGWEPKP